MKNLRILAPLSVGLAACIWLQSCSKPQAASTQSTNQLQGKLVLTGSSTVAPLAAEIGKRFEAEHSDVRIDVQSGGSSRGITDARKDLPTLVWCLAP
jgi:phosphate transport system substrate-binding protein